MNFRDLPEQQFYDNWEALERFGKHLRRQCGDGGLPPRGTQ
jgi:hypothetical protein